ncbi:uncharacterized protein LOC143217836 [Lasioglossum baleicum]|uniref:uncharacterized protein LOC143217836 n=1 Tax=Lasioglossum baleicum TaxID=434251 RepID=UPI003FCE73B1
MKKLNPAIVALSETRLIAEIEDSEISVPGYSVVRCDAETRNTGGVALYVRDDIKYEIVVSKKLERVVWCAAIEVKGKLFKGVLMVIYHSPSASHGEFIGFLEERVEEVTIKEECILLGDFNIDCMTDSYYTNKLLTTMQSLGMKQYIDKPTRVTNISKTIIDLVFANKEINVEVIYEPKITDHAWIKVVVNTNKIVDKYKEFSGRDYNSYNAVEFVKLVESNLETGQELDINIRARKLINSIVDALDISAPKKIFRIPKIWEGKKWYSKEIEELATKRDEAYKKARGNPTTMWKTLKEIIKGEPIGAKDVENIDFEILDNNMECGLADKFNLYYIQSIQDVIKSIDRNYTTSPNKRTIYYIEKEGELEKLEPITTEQLGAIIRELPKKKGTEEGITSDILRTAFSAIEWKTSTIIPIPKVDKPKRASDYRPINILPIYEKVLEIIVKKHIDDYWESNNILTEHQSGFRKNYSCETAIQTVIDEWKLSIRTALEWFRSYLKDRMQQVRLNNGWSKILTTEYGVPQGSTIP